MESPKNHTEFSIIHLKAGRLGHLPTGSCLLLVEGVSFFCVFDGSTTECIRYLQYFLQNIADLNQSQQACEQMYTNAVVNQGFQSRQEGEQTTVVCHWAVHMTCPAC